MYALMSNSEIFPRNLFYKESDCRKYNKKNYESQLRVVSVTHTSPNLSRVFICSRLEIKTRFNMRTGSFYQVIVRKETDL